MRRFAALYAELDASTATEAKVAALQRYLADAFVTSPTHHSADPALPAQPPDPAHQALLADTAWGVYFLAGGRPRQTVPTALLRAQATALAGIPDWLFDTCYQAVGDLAETIAQVLPPPRQHSALGLSAWLSERLLPMRGAPPEQQASALRGWWDELTPDGRFLLTKLIGGGFRVGVSKLLVQRALARHAGVDAKLIAQRMMGWTDARSLPSAERLLALLAPAGPQPAGDPEIPGLAHPDAEQVNGQSARQSASHAATDAHPTGQPYPFFLAHALAGAAQDFDTMLGPVQHWQAEWKYDGIRAQIVCDGGQVWIWSRGEELVTERFPEVVAQAQGLPEGTVLDGELLVWINHAPAGFNLLQQRLNRKTVSRKLLADAPVRFMAYDLLRHQHQDLRPWPQHRRRALLQTVLGQTVLGQTVLGQTVLGQAVPEGTGLLLSPLVIADNWPALALRRRESRQRGVEGLMLKHHDSAYGTGRTKADGVWWKWKIEPYTVDGVLIYAQAGHGRRSGLYTDYTFAVWSRPPADAAEAEAVVAAIARREPAVPGALQLLAFAKAYSGLTDAEFRAVDQVIRTHTLEKFGPVRSVRPTLVFELGFEGIARSPRHKSGVALRFPRMLRIRHDKPLHQADTLQTLAALIAGSPASG